jgi:hypothetical protein
LSIDPRGISYNKKRKMMQRISCLVIILSTTSAFSIHRAQVSRKFKTSLNYHPETFERAVDCASTYGLCNVDELLNLAKGQFCI